MARFEGDGTGYTRKPASHQELRLERAIADPDRPEPVAIEHVRPDVDAGRFSVKRVVGDTVAVTADVFTHGHTEIAVQLEYRHQAGRTWKRAPMRFAGNDHWIGTFPVEALGEYRFRIVAVARRSSRPGVATSPRSSRPASTPTLDCRRGRAARGAARQARELRATAPRSRRGPSACAAASTGRTIESLDRLVTVARRAADPTRRTVFDATSPVWVDRPLARCSAWYELFPRSASPDPDATRARSPTSSTGCRTSRRWASTSLYLPPIHPIGTTPPQGTRTTSTTRARRRPGEPVGDRRRPRAATPPCIPTSAPSPMSKRLVEAAAAPTTSRSRSTSRSRRRPTIRGSREHPQWFRHRPDGTIAYAENPPKRYEDIYPIDFDDRGPRRASGPRCSTSSASGSSAACACSASTTRTPSRSRSGSG